MTSSIDLGADLSAFILEHEYCGDLDAAVEAGRVWMTCPCAAVLVRVVTFGSWCSIPLKKQPIAP